MSTKINPTLSESDIFLALRNEAKNITVLYVEDDPMIRKEYFKFLSRFFDTVVCHEDGEAGLSAALNKKFDLVISDIQMPRMNGLQMIEKIKERYPDQATILISAHKDTDILHQSVVIGVDGYLFKPLERNQTIKLLYKTVSKIRLEYENLNYKAHLEELVAQKTAEAIKIFTIDPVTDLFTLAKLEQDMSKSDKYSLALLKIKDFKSLNDLYGYTIGNNLLKKTAIFLHSIIFDRLRRSDIVLYRVSGAHFALLSPLNAPELEDLVVQIIEHYESSEFIIADDSIYLEMDAGIVENQSTLTLSNADKALRISEKEGQIVLYKPAHQKAELHHFTLKCKDTIKRALNENRIIPYYQPIIDNNTNTIQKYEALARLIMPDGKVISPAIFLPVSKKTKMYNRITTTLIKTILHDFKTSSCSVSINLSIEDIKHIPTRKFIFDSIAAFPDPSRVVFELLESEEINSYHEIQQFIEEIKTYGCKVAIDDFGSGYSNFEYLTKLNADYIKIDGSLVREIDSDNVSRILVEMLAGFAKKMDIKTIAEFVHKDSIHTIVTSLGVHESQGYLFSEPIPYNASMQNIQYYAP